ncbi:hypothetical protein FVE85_2681 [Porphyridium purpureum]|uniref:Uncharacterized protein n=1 Tax=Porphyridium purpureum TaxID=35688 RepID=A0A5J4YU24_PORPP|nr:hypothetical protein FVE85_2681 [Porphyridium purpureum]|eukprot:POR1963..scf227_4
MTACVPLQELLEQAHALRRKTRALAVYEARVTAHRAELCVLKERREAAQQTLMHRDSVQLSLSSRDTTGASDCEEATGAEIAGKTALKVTTCRLDFLTTGREIRLFRERLRRCVHDEALIMEMVHELREIKKALTNYVLAYYEFP